MSEKTENKDVVKEESKEIAIRPPEESSLMVREKQFELMQREANLFANSIMVPDHFKKRPADCFIALKMAEKLKIDPFMLMQDSYVVYGKIAFEAKLAIAVINASGLFSDGLDFQISGDDPHNKDYKVRAFAKSKKTGQVKKGPWITWGMVKAEGWDKKKQNQESKWVTMPELMFNYRAAAFFARLHCPERLRGMRLVDEIQDIETSQAFETKNQMQQDINDQEMGSEIVDVEFEEESVPPSPNANKNQSSKESRDNLGNSSQGQKTDNAQTDDSFKQEYPPEEKQEKEYFGLDIAGVEINNLNTPEECDQYLSQPETIAKRSGLSKKDNDTFLQMVYKRKKVLLDTAKTRPGNKKDNQSELFGE